ncbi:hypothetical protein TNCV_2649741 [Trichonephila clavipes]|nr:hypothetical protein TNCV_2649741 [Trichonephila clavipes]
MLLKLYYLNEECFTAVLRSYRQKEGMKDFLHTSFGEDRVLSPSCLSFQFPRAQSVGFLVWGRGLPEVASLPQSSDLTLGMIKHNIRRQFFTISSNML